MILRPIARFCLRHSHSFQDFIRVAKIIFVQVAEEEILKDTDKVNVSRLSVMTGIHRKDVNKIFKEKKVEISEPVNILGRVIVQWQTDQRFTTRAGKPRILDTQGEEGGFQKLVKSVSKNINPGTVIFELERTGLAKRTKRGLKLLSLTPQLSTRQANIVESDDDYKLGYKMISEDLDCLIQAAEENLSRTRAMSNLHSHTVYDNLFLKDMPMIEKWLIDEGKAFHKKIRNFLAQYDKDTNPTDETESEQAGGMARVGIFSITRPLRLVEPPKSDT